MRLLIPVVSAALFLTAVSPVSLASAETTQWAMSAPACNIDPATESIATVDTLNGVVAFSGSNTGTIKLACPVSSRYNNFYDRFALSYNENESSGTTCSISAYLQRVSSLGTPFSGSTVASVSSVNGSGFAIATTNISHTIDANYFYWVYITISRTGTSCNPYAYGVTLYDAP